MFGKKVPVLDQAALEAFVGRIFETNDNVFHIHLERALDWAKAPENRVLVQMVLRGELDVSITGTTTGYVHLRRGSVKRDGALVEV